MRKTNCVIQFLMVTALLASSAIVFAQAGRVPVSTPTPTPIKKEPPVTLPAFKLITARGFGAFVRLLNDNGKEGYRVDKSLSYGGEGPTQNYVAYLRLEANNRYEYDWFSNPNKKILEAQLNVLAKKGFSFVNSYAQTYCSGGSEEDQANPTSPESLLFRMSKGDGFLFERKNASTEPVKEYKVFMAKVHLGDSAEKNLQAAIDEVRQQGFHPAKILFARYGLMDFTISVMVEKDLRATNVTKVEYRFLKKTSGGLPKEVNTLAAQGFRFVSGRRVGMIVMMLMAKQANDAAVYSVIDEKKYLKEFDKIVAQGNSYQGIVHGDFTCGSTEVENEKFIFTQNVRTERHDYKIVKLENGAMPTEASSEFQRLLNDGYKIKDFFYFGELTAILEK